MDIEEPKRLAFGLVFSLLFPLFGIFIFSGFELMGISLYNDIFLGFAGNFSTAIYEWFFAMFRADVVNQIIQFGAQSIVQEPFTPSLLTWFTTGYLLGVIIKKFKIAFLLSLVTPLFHFILLVIFALISGTLTVLFTANLTILLGGLLTTFTFIFLGAYLGGLAGR